MCAISSFLFNVFVSNSIVIGNRTSMNLGCAIFKNNINDKSMKMSSALFVSHSFLWKKIVRNNGEIIMKISRKLIRKVGVRSEMSAVLSCQTPILKTVKYVVPRNLYKE